MERRWASGVEGEVWVRSSARDLVCCSVAGTEESDKRPSYFILSKRF